MDFMYGAISAAISKTSVAPVERLKLLLQTRYINSNNKMTHIVSNILSKQGILSFWRGNLPNVIRYFPLQAFMLSFKEQFKGIFVPQSKDASNVSIITGHVMAGGTAGCAAITLIYPLDLTRTRLAVDMGGSSREFGGISDCLRKTYQSGGIRSWYQGLTASYCCYFIYRGLQIGGYDAAKRIYGIDLKAKGKGKGSQGRVLGISFLMSYAVSSGAMTVAYPFDTVRRKMMMQAGVSQEMKTYHNMLQCWTYILTEYGFQGLYRGLAVNYFRALGSSLVLVLFDCFKSYGN